MVRFDEPSTVRGASNSADVTVCLREANENGRSPRHSDVDNRAEQEEEHELGKSALHGDKGYSIR